MAQCFTRRRCLFEHKKTKQCDLDVLCFDFRIRPTDSLNKGQCSTFFRSLKNRRSSSIAISCKHPPVARISGTRRALSGNRTGTQKKKDQQSIQFCVASITTRASHITHAPHSTSNTAPLHQIIQAASAKRRRLYTSTVPFFRLLLRRVLHRVACSAVWCI